MTDPSLETARTHWGIRALAYARAIAGATPGRGSTTRDEAAAAESVRRQLALLGVGDVRTQAFLGQRSIWLFLAQAFGLALAGHAAFWLLPRPLGVYPALLIAVAAFSLSFFILWRQFTFRNPPSGEAGFRPANNLPHGPSQNVIAIFPPGDDVQRRLVLLAHLDSHRAVWVFAHPLLARGYSFLTPLVLWGVVVAPLLYALAVLTAAPVFGWLALLLALLHFIAWFTGVTADLGPYSPGANDNASAVGSLLALAERLQQSPLAHTEVWLAFTGCEESGGDGMLHLLAEHSAALKDALFLDLELVGIGDRLVYLETEGMLRRRTLSPGVRSLVQQAAQRLAAREVSRAAVVPAVLFPASPTLPPEAPRAVEPLARHPMIQPLRASLRGAYTEMGIAWEHGFQGVCLMVFSSTEHGLPQWHRLTDTTQNYQESAFTLAHDFVWELLHVWDGTSPA